MPGGGFRFDVGQAEAVKKLLIAFDADVTQYKSSLLNLIDDQLEPGWESSNKQGFINDWKCLHADLATLSDLGPQLIGGLTKEINLVTQAEQVQL